MARPDAAGLPRRGPGPGVLDVRAAARRPVATRRHAGLDALGVVDAPGARADPRPGEHGACPRGGMDAPTPKGLPINLATALQLAGVRPLDIAAATAQVEQALALQLQAKALWIPNLNGGVDYFRHDGVQQNIFTGENFRKGRQSFFVGGGPYLSVGLTDAIFTPLAARRVVAVAARPTFRRRGTTCCSRSPQAFFDLQAARGRLLGIDASIARAELLVNFTRGAGPQPDRAAGDQPGADRAPEPAADPAGRHPRLAGRQRPAGGGPAARPGHAARAGRAAVPAGHAGPLRPDARGAGADRREQPPRDRLAARAGRRGRAAPPPREEPPVPAEPVRPQPDRRPPACSRPATSPPAPTGR